MRGRGAIAAAAFGAAGSYRRRLRPRHRPRGRRCRPTSSTSRRLAEHAAVTEGKFDEVRGQGRPRPHGPLRLQDARRERSDEPEAAGRVPAGRPGRGGYWQNEDMELDTKRKLIIGALDPRHTGLGATSTSPCPPGGSTRRSGLQERLLRHLVRRPEEHQAGRRLRRAAVGPHVELHPGLQVHLDRRPGAATTTSMWLGPILRSDRARAVHVPARSWATAGRSG